MTLQIGQTLVITTDEKVVGRKGIISVKNCPEFSQSLLDNQ